jgi:hypothetical protein
MREITIKLQITTTWFTKKLVETTYIDWQK